MTKPTPEPTPPDTDVPKPGPPKPALRQLAGQWPLASVLLVVAVGLVIVAFGHWRLGSTVVGAAVAGGGLLRLCLRDRAGLLVVRRLFVDVVLLLSIGVGILVVAWLVPPTRR